MKTVQSSKERHYRYTDDELEQVFSEFRLKPVLFTHECHLRLAYHHINKYGKEKAASNMCEQISGYAQSLKVPEKFNKTVSIAAVEIMYEFMSQSKSDNFKSLLEEYPELKNDFKGLVLRHYSFPVFGDVKAKKEFISPDLKPFG